MADTMVVDVSRDWATACDVQQRFMSRAASATQGIRYSARCRQLRALGGDCYDFLTLPHNQLAFAIADASGKSLPAALMIANVQSSLRTAAWFAPEDAAAVVGAVNRQVHASSLADRYATLFYGVFDEDARALQYVNAGHNSPIIVRGGRLLHRLDEGGPPVGLFSETVYQTGVVQLKPGDLIVAYTDGVVETADAAGREWGVDGLFAAITACAMRDPDAIIEAAFLALDEFSGNRQSDDATILVSVVH